jgi:hypothetical protein
MLQWIRDLDQLLRAGIYPQDAARMLGKPWRTVVRVLGQRELTDRPLGPHVRYGPVVTRRPIIKNSVSLYSLQP